MRKIPTEFTEIIDEDKNEVAEENGMNGAVDNTNEIKIIDDLGTEVEENKETYASSNTDDNKDDCGKTNMSQGRKRHKKSQRKREG